MTDETDPYYESGDSGVRHKNIDAAGSSHPFGDSPKEWQADLRPLIREMADSLYKSWEATVREYLANAETACLKVEQFLQDESESPYDNITVDEGYEGRIVVTWDKSKRKLIIKDNGIGMTAAEVDKVFRYIGRTAARGLGTMSGAFGMGALSFLKFIGADNSSMVMKSNSRLNEDNASYLVTLAGIEPVRGSLDDDDYGTVFELDQKQRNMDVRSAVRRYAKNMRVKVLYREIDEDGEEVFNEDWGDRKLYENYSDNNYASYFIKEDMFAAYVSPDANSRTLLLSMEIDRNGGKYSSPYEFDVRIMDESGKVVESSNGNEGLIPVPRAEYNDMLIKERSESIIERLLSNNDIVVETSEDIEADYLVDKELLESDQALPVADYATFEDVDEENLDDTTKEVIIGPHSGREVITPSEWDDLPEGRAENFVPEDELEEFDLDTGEGDLCLPKPTTDRSSLQDNKKFWRYIRNYFTEEFDKSLDMRRKHLQGSDDTEKALEEMEVKTARKMRRELEC